MAHLQIDPTQRTPRENYFLLTGLVVPRPIAWVSTLDGDGNRNLAPHSYFNIVSNDPPILHFTQTGRKDTLNNVETTGEFVISLVSMELVKVMNLTAADFPPGEDEFAWAQLDATPSTHVAPPRVAAAKAAFECRVRTILPMGNGNMVFGDVVAIHLDEDIFPEGRVDIAGLKAVGRLGGSWYAAVDDPFRLDRPTWADLHMSATE